MKTYKARLRAGESLSINGYNGEITEGRLFDYKYSKGDEIGIIIDGEIYPEASTAFEFVEIKLPSAKQMYAIIEQLANNVFTYNDYSKQISQISEIITSIERTN